MLQLDSQIPSGTFQNGHGTVSTPLRIFMKIGRPFLVSLNG